MVTEELVLESSSLQRYAPPVEEAVEAAPLIDHEFEKELSSVPDKMAFKIGEVAVLANVKPYVLRYWESEFGQLKPQKSKKNQRIYSRKDVETVLMIKKLLYKDKFSIEGARVAIRRLKKDAKKAKRVNGMMSQIEKIRLQTEDLILDIGRLKRLFK